MAFSTNGISGGDGLSFEINVTPLIDVLLVVLIIFIVIVLVLPRGLHSALPSPAPASAVDQTADRPILVQVEQRETAVRYLVDGTEIERSEVSPHLRKLLSRRSGREMLLKADAKLDFDVIAAVIDAGQAAGADSVGLVTPGTGPSIPVSKSDGPETGFTHDDRSGSFTISAKPPWVWMWGQDD